MVLTIDTTVTGMKRKDKHNGFAIPPQLSAATMAGLARHPGWVADILTTEPLRFATFPEGSEYGRWGMSNQLREQEIRPADVAWLARSGAVRSSSRACCRSPTRWPRSTPARPRSCCPTTAAASSTGPRCRSSCCRALSRRSPVGRRCTSTPAIRSGGDVVAASRSVPRG